MVAEADDALMERFFEVGTLTQEELVTGLRKAALTGKIAPLVCASALANIGIPLVLDAIVDYLPSPAERPFPALDAATARRSRARPRRRPVRRIRLEDRGRPVRGADHAVPRDDAARSRPIRRCTT